MKILMVASEATPYAKTGGLADVIGALPVALVSRGEQVAVVMPLYRQAAGLLETAERVYDDMLIATGLHLRKLNVRRVTDRGVQFYFIDEPSLYDRDELYTEAGEDYPDNAVRFGVLCRAALGVVRHLFRPHVIQYHDWQGSLVAPLMRRHFSGDPTFYGIKLLLTIHNLGYQGLFPRQVLSELGLPADLYHPYALEFHKQINLLKGGIVFADAINTVSRGYAREIQTKELGFGLEGLLQGRSDVLCGIVNGVDYSEWSPENDKYIVALYTREDLSGKLQCKRDLLERFGLPVNRLDRPVIGMVSRFVDQKGFDLVEEIAPELTKLDVGIGSGETRYEEMFQSLTQAFPEKVCIKIGYDNEIAHKIEAGADIFLMPSRYEPCGLNQIYSLRYGTVPVVRATGGLDDTIEEGTGFKFTEYSGDALLGAIRAALAAYHDRKRWTAMMQTGMAKDFSWSASAAEYSALYRSMAAGGLNL
jgi:starch synthase